MVSALVLSMVIGQDFKPIDDGPRDRSFVEFRRNLIGSIVKKKYDWVINRIHKDITFSFGFDDGIDQLKYYWSLNEGGKEKWMNELLTAMRLGGQFETYDDGTKLFSAPYVNSAWPDDLDAFENMAVIKRDAPVYAKPDKTSKLLTKLTHQIVAIDMEPDWNDDYKPILLASGGTGWMSSNDVRSPIDYRARLTQISGSWTLVVFIAGD